MLSNLPEDCLFEIGKYLSIKDTLRLESSFKLECFSELYNPYARTIQKWYKKYRKARCIRYEIYVNEYRIHNEYMHTTRYAEMYFLFHDVKKLIAKLRTYYFYSLLKYYYRYESDKEEMINNYEYTVKYPSYSKLKNFLRVINIKLLHRVNGM